MHRKKNATNTSRTKHMRTHIDTYLRNVATILGTISYEDIEKMITQLLFLKKRQGRLFLIGVGGSAANCSHAVNDFRKICNIESYAPSDNIAELTARTNDDGWDTVFINWLKGSRLNKNDAVLVLSVGGGDVKKNVSVNIVKALKYAKKVGSMILGIVSRDGGYTKKVAQVCILIPTISGHSVTPYAESFQVLILHAIVNYPDLKG